MRNFSISQVFYGKLQKFEAKSFSEWAENFRPLVENLSAGLLELHSTCPEELLREDSSFEKNLFLDIERKIFDPLANFFRQGCQTKSYMSILTNLG